MFDHAVFHHGEAGEQRLIVYSPSCEHDTRAKLARLLEDDEADSRDLAPATAAGSRELRSAALLRPRDRCHVRVSAVFDTS